MVTNSSSTQQIQKSKDCLLEDAIVFAVNTLKPNFLLKDFQKDIVVSVVKNKFSVTNARTGSGKSFAYMLLPYVFKYLRINKYYDSFVGRCCSSISCFQRYSPLKALEDFFPNYSTETSKIFPAGNKKNCMQMNEL